MVKFKRGQGGQVVLKKATHEELGEASAGLKALIAERERLVRELWGKFVGRWGGRVERRDDGTMFVVEEGRHVRDLAQEDWGEGEGKKKLEDQVEDDEADPYVRRMREVQARMEHLIVAEERKKAKWAKAGKA